MGQAQGCMLIVDPKADKSFDDLHMRFGEYLSAVPLKIVLDRRPFIRWGRRKACVLIADLKADKSFDDLHMRFGEYLSAVPLKIVLDRRPFI